MKRLFTAVLIWGILNACALVSPTAPSWTEPPPVEETAGSQALPTEVPTEMAPDYLAVIEAYLVEKIGQASFGGKVFCAYDVLGETRRPDEIEVYVWALCAEYYLEGGALTMGSGSSLPVALYVQEAGRRYQVVGHKIPGDGTQYWPDIQRIFPPEAIEKMCHTDTECYNERAMRLQSIVEAKAREAYGIE